VPGAAFRFHACAATHLPTQSSPRSLQVSLTPLSATGSYIEGAWAGEPSALYPQLAPCPDAEGAQVAPSPAGLKSEALKNAVIAALQGSLYGFDAASGQSSRPADVPDVDYSPGQVLVKRGGGLSTLVYAITEVRCC
jgi:hypothetical protein